MNGAISLLVNESSISGFNFTGIPFLYQSGFEIEAITIVFSLIDK